MRGDPCPRTRSESHWMQEQEANFNVHRPVGAAVTWRTEHPELRLGVSLYRQKQCYRSKSAVTGVPLVSLNEARGEFEGRPRGPWPGSKKPDN